MGHISWIYDMVQNNTYQIFRKLYKQALKDNDSQFIWEGEIMQTNAARFICALVDEHIMDEYNEHLAIQADIQADIADDYILE